MFMVSYTKNRGFSLIELMIVIAIIGILAAVALPQFASMSEDAKKTKAKQDCDTIVQAVTRFNALEGVALKSLDELAGKYITNIKELRDPWGNPYEINTGAGFVFSMGPDGQSPYKVGAKGDKSTGKDDIKVSYIGDLMLTDVTIAIDVGASENLPQGQNDTMDSMTLIFNKDVGLVDETKKELVEGDGQIQPTIAEMDAGGDGIFQWYRGTGNVEEKSQLFAQGQTFFMYRSPEDAREIIIDINRHSLSKIVPNYHLININSNESKVKYFYESIYDKDDESTQKKAKKSGSPCKIRRE